MHPSPSHLVDKYKRISRVLQPSLRHVFINMCITRIAHFELSYTRLIFQLNSIISAHFPAVIKRQLCSINVNLDVWLASDQVAQSCFVLNEALGYFVSLDCQEQPSHIMHYTQHRFLVYHTEPERGAIVIRQITYYGHLRLS